MMLTFYLLGREVFSIGIDHGDVEVVTSTGVAAAELAEQWVDETGRHIGF